MYLTIALLKKVDWTNNFEEWNYDDMEQTSTCSEENNAEKHYGYLNQYNKYITYNQIFFGNS